MKKLLRKIEKKIGLYTCLICKNKTITPLSYSKLWVEPLNQFVTSNNKSCRDCQKILKVMVKKM